jgi:hypothetical protein
MFFSKKKNHEPGCLACHIVVSAFLFLSTVAALLGVLMSHYDPRQGMLIFGTNADSLSLVAFVLSLTLWMKSMQHCMGKCEMCGTMGKK